VESLSGRNAIDHWQLNGLRQMLRAILPANEFYQGKFSAQRFVDGLPSDGLKSLPFTTKNELVENQALYPPFGTDLTFPLERYIRIHQTSGTTGKPMYWLDTEESWNWWADCWQVILEAAGVRAGDRIYFAFSFGPFIGFWAGWEGARKLGAMAVSGGGQSTSQRLKAIIDYGATVLVCTPTYALHMASEARKAGMDLAKESAIRIAIHAGEPGASIPSTRQRIEDSWGARCFDHPGATEVGAFAFECQSRSVHLNENEFLAEILDPNTGERIGEGELGELVITNLGRIGSPVIRYKTGDLVQPNYQPCPCGRPFLRLQGGVLGRVDDMVVVRGVNVFPSAIENIIREIPEIEEFRVEIFEKEEMLEIKLLLEPRADESAVIGLAKQASQRVRECIGFRPHVELVKPGTLPRFELKAKRFFKL
jgi:phenylacetate-CoA ligase